MAEAPTAVLRFRHQLRPFAAFRRDLAQPPSAFARGSVAGCPYPAGFGPPTTLSLIELQAWRPINSRAHLAIAASMNCATGFLIPTLLLQSLPSFPQVGCLQELTLSPAPAMDRRNRRIARIPGLRLMAHHPVHCAE